MGALDLRKVTPYEFLNYTFREPVYVQLHSEDYYTAKDGSAFSSWDFHHHPDEYKCKFSDPASFAGVTDLFYSLYILGSKSGYSVHQSKNAGSWFSSVWLPDVTCDLNGSIPSTTKATTIENKFYGYDPMTEEKWNVRKAKHYSNVSR